MRFDAQSEDDEFAESSEINVTPFIDVMLVLLIIFMVAAPLATANVPVELPSVSANPTPRNDEPIILTVTRDLALHLGEEEVAREALGSALDAASAGDHERRIFLRADRAVAYGDLMGVMNALRASGYLKVALVGLEDGTAQ
jgi:biopolymer transport protein ExbD